MTALAKESQTALLSISNIQLIMSLWTYIYILMCPAGNTPSPPQIDEIIMQRLSNVVFSCVLGCVVFGHI